MARLLHEPEARRRAARVPIQLSGPGASAQDASEEDLPGITVSQTYLNIPEGQSRSYTVVLNSRPTAGVRVRVAVSGDQRNSASEFRCCGRSSVWFGPDDWNQPETFTVTAPEDADTDHGTLWVRHWADSDDPDYHAIPIATVTATAVDDDTGLGLGTPARPDGHGGPAAGGHPADGGRRQRQLPLRADRRGRRRAAVLDRLRRDDAQVGRLGVGGPAPASVFGHHEVTPDVRPDTLAYVMH